MPRRPRVLLADDDRDLIELLTLRCWKLNLDVVAADNSLEALNLIQMALPDLICLDVHMPAGNGLSVAEMIQSEPTWSHVPIIILTGRDDPLTIRRCHDLCVYYVIKGGDVWPRVGPLICELLNLEAPASVQLPGAVECEHVGA